jgi:hypothetical protein
MLRVATGPRAQVTLRCQRCILPYIKTATRVKTQTFPICTNTTAQTFVTNSDINRCHRHLIDRAFGDTVAAEEAFPLQASLWDFL